MPIRQVDPDDDRRIYRSFQYGDLLDLIMIDTRLDHRAQQLNAFGMNQTASEFQSKVYAPLDGRGIMSENQRAWIEDEFTESLERGAKWRIVGNQIALNYYFFPIPHAQSPMPHSLFPKKNFLRYYSFGYFSN